MGILLLAMVTANVSAEVYKWKDKDGVTRYSDIAPQGNTPFESLKSKKPASGSVAATDTSQQANKTVGSKADDKSATPGDSAGKTTDQKEAQRKAKEKACVAAKENLQKLKQGVPVYKENAKGEREYLDETSIKNEAVVAEKEVAAACN
ncbi:MAG: DUF4124 domain-containing protein [Candidatus Methylopumilus sp.]